MPYNNKFYERHAKQYAFWEIAIGEDIAKRFDIKSCIDFGCGVGSYLEGMQKHGVSIFGIELNYEAAKPYIDASMLPYIYKGDATVLKCGFKHGLVLSVETAEHIDPNKTQVFIDNLTNIADKMIILTAAPPGQRGTNHINCRPKLFWIEEIEKRGFKHQPEIVEECKTEWKKYGTAKWVLNNLMIFTR